MANQVNIPVIQTQGSDLTQVQQNINKVLNNIYGQLVTLAGNVSLIQSVGDVLFSPLGLSQFQDSHGEDWVVANGQSSVGTTYQSITGNNVVPTITLSGATAYIKVN